jgi:hypothetical protein
LIAAITIGSPVELVESRSEHNVLTRELVSFERALEQSGTNVRGKRWLPLGNFRAHSCANTVRGSTNQLAGRNITVTNENRTAHAGAADLKFGLSGRGSTAMLGGNRHGAQRRHETEVATLLRPKPLTRTTDGPPAQSGTFQIAKPAVRTLSIREVTAKKR